MTRLRAFFTRYPFLCVWLAMALIVVTGFYIQEHNRDEAVRNAQRTAEDNKAAICRGFEAYTTSLLQVGKPPATEVDRAAQQKRVDDFVAYFERQVYPLPCHFDLPPIPPVVTK